ncbi:MAG: hypothetical protein Q8P31_03220 [Bacillota bacterium]|nr:hypothetical protein [Bacillota bacterium]
MNQLPAVWSVASSGLRRGAGRRVLMIAILALTTAVYMLYSTYLLGAGGEAQALIDDPELPADVVFVGRRTLTDDAIQDIARRSSVSACEPARVIWYKSPAGYLRLIALPRESRLWSSVLGASAAAPPTSQQVLIPRGLAEQLGLSAGQELPLVPPQATAGRFSLQVAGTNEATDDVLRTCLITLLGGNGPRANSLFVWTRNEAGARSLASLLALDYGVPSRPFLRRMDDPLVLTASTAASLSAEVLAQKYMPGVSALGLVFVFCGIGLFCITSLSFMDRRRDLAILKTMGLESRGLLALLLIEQGAIALCGVVAGTLLAVALLARLGSLFPGPATLSAVTALKGALVGAFVLGAAASLPAALARAATVNELLFNLPVSLYRQRVGGAAGS